MPSPDAQYVIDIAAGMREGEHTAKELDRLTDALTTGGRQADFFDAALGTLDAALRDASAGAAQAAQALAAGSAEFRAAEAAANIASKAHERLVGRQEGLKKAADIAARALEAERRALEGVAEPTDEQTANLRKLAAAAGRTAKSVRTNAAAQADAAARAAAANSALDAQADSLRDLEKAAHDTAEAERKLTRQQAQVAKMSKHVDDRLGRQVRGISVFRGALGDVGGPLAEFGERLLYPVQAFGDLNEEFGRNTAIVTVGVGLWTRAATTLAMLTAGMAAATAAATGMAIAVADNREQTDLTRRAWAALRPELATVIGQYDAIADRTGLASSGVEALARQLAEGGTRAGDMPTALEAMAKAESALGSGGAAKFLSDLKSGRTTVADLAYEIDSKFGGVVEGRLLGLGAQTERLKRNLGGLFDEVEPGPALEAFDRIVGLFQAGTTSGDAMRAMLGDFFNPLIEGAETVERFFLGFMIGVVKDITTLKELFAGSILGDLIPSFQNAAEWGETVSVAFSALVATAGILGAVVLAVPAAFVALAYAISGAIDILRDLGGTMIEVGGDMIDGLIDGITSGATRFRDAIIDTVSGGIDAVKRFLGIASPSKRAAREVGGPLGQGVAVGVEHEGQAVKRALQSITDPALAAAGAMSPVSLGVSAANGNAAAVGGAAAGVGGNVYHLSFAGAVFNFGSASGTDNAEDFASALTRVLEGDALAVGAAA